MINRAQHLQRPTEWASASDRNQTNTMKKSKNRKISDREISLVREIYFERTSKGVYPFIVWCNYFRNLTRDEFLSCFDGLEISSPLK